MRLVHAALWVSDLDRSLAFYEALGMEAGLSYARDGVENVYVGDGEESLQLKHDPDREREIAPDRTAVDHVSFAVEDLDATVDAAVEAGGSIVTAPTHVAEADSAFAFVADPDGHTLEFIEGL
ncbi:VOC family protein [Halobellus rubicundus]|uniref:VOC family protein n=1 Tax=Halobellus rubicundus TaxID=2996466 RepID=A0ABD5MFU0_9EURY